MKKFTPKQLVLIGCVVLAVVVYAAASLASNQTGNQGATPSRDTEEVSEPNGTLSKVNPEERYPLLVQAGVPYENDQFAILYRVDNEAPGDVVIRVIDKTPGATTVTPAVGSAALAFLNDRGIQATSVKIEYEVLANAR